MLKYEELKEGKTKVLLPNDIVGVVTSISPMKTMKGGLLRGRDKVKCAYSTPNGGMTEAWFQLSKLRKYEIVIKKIATDVQPVEKGKEPWKSEDTFNGTEIIDQAKTEEVIVPMEDETKTLSDAIPVNTQSYDGELTKEMIENLNVVAPRLSPLTEDELKNVVEDNKEVINELPDISEEDKAIDDDNTEMIG